MGYFHKSAHKPSRFCGTKFSKDMELFIGDLYILEMNEELFITLRAKQRRVGVAPAQSHDPEQSTASSHLRWRLYVWETPH